MPTGDQIRRPPAHAGRLPPWERLAIALVLLVVAALVIVMMMSAEPPHRHAPDASPWILALHGFIRRNLENPTMGGHFQKRTPTVPSAA